MKIAVTTIGFTKSTAARFFDRLKQASVRQVMDVRLHNTSQLAGFAKADDLAYFLKTICGAGYVHEPLLAPTEEILKGFKQEKGAWDTYQKQFMKLMAARRIETKLKPALFDHTCLLCSEATPHHCHRQLVCTYLNGKWGGSLSVTHL
jgi:uncharacterized protein (DUF488 family)